MGEFPTRKHSDELIAAIASASKRLKNAEIHKRLAAGTLPEYPGVYEMPYATVSYFVRKHKAEQRAGAHALHERATGDMHAALDGFGREIATELFKKLEYERSKRSPDTKKLAELATIAAKVKPLIKDTPAKTVAAPKAKDPWLAKLEGSAKAKPRKPKPQPASEEQPVPPSPAWLSETATPANGSPTPKQTSSSGEPR